MREILFLVFACIYLIKYGFNLNNNLFSKVIAMPITSNFFNTLQLNLNQNYPNWTSKILLGPLRVKGIVALYKAILSGTLLSPSTSTHSKPSHTKHASIWFSNLHILHLSSSNEQTIILPCSTIQQLFRCLILSSNSKPFVCSEHLKICPCLLLSFNLFVIADTIFNLKPWI